jgi:hypothetical protein
VAPVGPVGPEQGWDHYAGHSEAPADNREAWDRRVNPWIADQRANTVNILAGTDSILPEEPACLQS